MECQNTSMYVRMYECIHICIRYRLTSSEPTQMLELVAVSLEHAICMLRAFFTSDQQ